MSNEQTVKDVYSAFQRGDVAAIVACVADDVDWRNDGVESRECPWNGNFSGKANLPGFFKALGEHPRLLGVRRAGYRSRQLASGGAPAYREQASKEWPFAQE